MTTRIADLETTDTYTETDAPITAGELITALQAFPKESEVVIVFTRDQGLTIESQPIFELFSVVLDQQNGVVGMVAGSVE